MCLVLLLRNRARSAVIDQVFVPATTPLFWIAALWPALYKEPKEPALVSQPGSTLLVEKTKDNIHSLEVLLKSDFKVDFAVGTADDSCFDGTLYTPEGILIQLVFYDNL